LFALKTEEKSMQSLPENKAKRRQKTDT